MAFGMGSYTTKNSKGSSGSKSPGIDSNQGYGRLNLKNRLTALIVDDNRVNRLIHKALLNYFSIDNQEAADGREAVELCQSGAEFDLILMDMEMPIMNGPEATRTLRAMGVQSMIVGVTAHSREEECQAFMEAGLNHLHEKPLTQAKLVSILRAIDNRHR